MNNAKVPDANGIWDTQYSSNSGAGYSEPNKTAVVRVDFMYFDDNDTPIPDATTWDSEPNGDTFTSISMTGEW